MNDQRVKTDPYLAGIVSRAVMAHHNPMDCNMFEKKCTLLTCHTKHRCLWTKEEAEKERNPESKSS